MSNFEEKDFAEQQGISLVDLWRVAFKKRWLIIAVAVAAFALAGLASFLATPIYTAEGQVLIEREPNILSFEDIFQIESFNDDYFRTQHKLLQSRALAGDTIDRMRLYENGAFLKSAIGGTNRNAAELKNDPLVRSKLIDSFLRSLTIQPVKQTRLVQARFSDRDPKFAAEALNSMFDAFIEMNVQKKYQASEQAADFLTKQIATVQAEIEGNEQKLQEYGKEKNIIALNSTENTVIEKLGELNKALTDAQIDRVNKETYYNEIAVATPDYIPDALSNPMIQKLREEYNRLNRDYLKKSETFLPNYPEMQTLRVELDSAKKALEDETQALIKRAYGEYQAALKREYALSAVFNRQKGEAFQLNSNAIQYNSLQIQIQNAKNLLESLMKRKSETDVSSRLKNLRASNIWIVDKAEIPSGPSSPKKKKNMILGLLVGLFCGFGLAFLTDRLDTTIKGTDDIKKYSGMPTLGIVPTLCPNGRKKGPQKSLEKETDVAKEKLKVSVVRFMNRILNAVGLKDPGTAGDQESMDLIVHFSPKSAFSEHYRSIRTSLLLSEANNKMGAIMVTSPLPQEGKTATVSNLAVALAQTGKSVVIIDADLRMPRLHKIFRVKNLNGLTKYLTMDLSLEDMLRATPIPTLYLINAGPVPPNPVELLGSGKMANLISRLKEDFDYVLVDTPPLLVVSDAIVLGPGLDGVIIVVREGKTPREALKLAQEKLSAHNIKGRGVIINHFRLKDLDYYYKAPYSEYGGGIQS